MGSDTDIALMKQSIKAIEEGMKSHIENDKKRFEKFDVKFDNIDTKIDERADQLEETFRQSINELKNGFAAKWVENAILWSAKIVGGAVLLAGIGYILSRFQ